MIKDFAQSDKKLSEYAEQTFRPSDALLDEIHLRSERSGLPPIQVGRMDGLHLEVLTRAFGAKKIVEIGTLGGYSGVSLLRGAGRAARLYTFEYEPRHAEVARESFRKANLASQVEVFVGPALENLPKIVEQGPFDLVFIDADKENYPHYLEWAAKNLRLGGAVLADNTFAWGHIADDTFDDPEIEAAVIALREFNRLCANGGRFRSTIIPTGEGLTLAIKL